MSLDFQSGTAGLPAIRLLNVTDQSAGARRWNRTGRKTEAALRGAPFGETTPVRLPAVIFRLR